MTQWQIDARHDWTERYGFTGLPVATVGRVAHNGVRSGK
jgi:hypothetical protein